MSEIETLEERLRAVERALTDGAPPGDADRTSGDTDRAPRNPGGAREVDELTERVDDLESRLDELDASIQAVRGYVGNLRAVNEAVERRADAALAKAEALEGTSADGSRPPRPPSTRPSPSAAGTPSPNDPDLEPEASDGEGVFDGEGSTCDGRTTDDREAGDGTSVVSRVREVL